MLTASPGLVLGREYITLEQTVGVNPVLADEQTEAMLNDYHHFIEGGIKTCSTHHVDCESWTSAWYRRRTMGVNPVPAANITRWLQLSSWEDVKLPSCELACIVSPASKGR